MIPSKTSVRHYELFIDGEFVANSARAMVPVINPATEEVVSEIPSGTVADGNFFVQDW